MKSLRRTTLESLIAEDAAAGNISGDVLDVGGVRAHGLPDAHFSSWKYINVNPMADPDWLATVEKIPAPDLSYDTVICTEVLEYVEDREDAIREIRRVMKGGGYSIISVPLFCPIHGDTNKDLIRLTHTGVELMMLSGGFGRGEFKILPMGGVGSVIFGFLKCYFETLMRPWISNKVLWCIRPAFRLLDKISRGHNKYITTGYYIRAQKDFRCYLPIG